MQTSNVHFLGISEQSLSATAAIASNKGYLVTGCDKAPPQELSKNLQQLFISRDHAVSHINDINYLVVAPALLKQEPNHIEITAARKKNIPVITWEEFVGKHLTIDTFLIAVAGTHGKSTTTAMIGLLLEDAGFEPTVLLDEVVPSWGHNYRIGTSKYMIVEIDELSETFLYYSPDILIVTNIETNHPEYFKSFDQLKQSFRELMCSSKKNVVVNLSDHGIIETIDKGLDCTIHGFHGVNDQGFILDYSKTLIDFPLKIPGEFNIYNASAVFYIGLLLEIDSHIIKHSLMNYQGINRRFEFMGLYKQAHVYTDFADHPTELQVTMIAAREKFPTNRLILVFQPYSSLKTKLLYHEFVDVFQTLPVDVIYVVDTYSPVIEAQEGIDSKQLVNSINKDHVMYLDNEKQFSHFSEINPTDILFFIGSGDIYFKAQKLLELSHST